MDYKDLGYKKYQDYVDGEGGNDWQEIKDYFFKHCGAYICAIPMCGNHWRLSLHKRSYRFLTLGQIKKKYIFKILIVRYLKKNMCWLCFPHNGRVHFKNNKKVPLSYHALVERENEVFREDLWKKIGPLRPSDFFRWIAKTYAVN